MVAPLVLGGVVQPAHAVGARAALALMDAGAAPSDTDLASRVELARVAQARRLVPIDTVEGPSGAEWALAAVVHDLLQVTNPSWIRKSAPKRLLDLALATLDRVPPAATAREALSRHTWLARLFDLRRHDTAVSWWTGSREFHGKPPPKRLFAWPGLRRVSVARAERGLTELLGHGGIAEHAPAFEAALTHLLRASPLTDFATCARRAPPFVWTPEGLAMVRTPVARTLALRAVSLGPMDEADAALGRATRALFAAKTWRDASTALDFLGHRAMGAGQGPAPSLTGDGTDDAAFARAAGAMVARRWLDEPSTALSEGERRRLAPVFDAAARTGTTQSSRPSDRRARDAPRALGDRSTSAGSSSAGRRTFRTSPRASPARGTGGTRSAQCPRSAPSPKASAHPSGGPSR